MQAAVAETTFVGLGDTLTPGRLKNNCALTAATSQANPYRCFPASDDSGRLHCKRKLPVTEAERPVCGSYRSRTWRDVDADEVVERGEVGAHQRTAWDWQVTSHPKADTAFA